VTGRQPPATGRPPAVRTIAVGIDGSPDAEAALDWAAALGRQTGAAVVAVHAEGLLEHGGDRERLVGELEATLARVAADHGLAPGGFRLVTDAGEPCSVLCRAAGAPVDADLLVVGSRGRGAHAGLVLGSTSHALAERAPVPLVIVGSRGSAARAPN
jgi:nucleotide-binding universal stress UspA family protein